MKVRRHVRSSVLLCALITGSTVHLHCTEAVTEPDHSAADESRTAGYPIDGYVGQWDWKSSCGGIGGWCFTPETAGYAFRLDFSQTGEFEALVDDTLRAAGTFSITKEDSRSVILYGVSLGEWSDRHWISLNGVDTLELDDGCCDMYVHRFVRRGTETD